MKFSLLPLAVVGAAAVLLPVSWSFSVPSKEPKPPAFVKDFIVPWFEGSRKRFKENHVYSHDPSPDFHLPPEFQKAAVRYEQELGIPQEFFHAWVSHMFRVDEDGDMFWKKYDQIANWGSNGSVCIPIEGGDFDCTEVYCRLVSKTIRDTKEKILRAIDSSDTLKLPIRFDTVPRAELVSSHNHDESFQTVCATLLEQQGCEVVPWEIRMRTCGYWPDWFVSMSAIRVAHYFPPETWKNDHPQGKDIHKALDGIFESTEGYQATQKHLVKHSAEWMLDPGSILQLNKEIAGPLFSRHHSHSFLTQGAMDMSPKDLLHFERDAILDMPFAGLDDLDDTPRVKVLRTERAVQDVEQKLNTTLLRHFSFLEIPASGLGKTVGAILCAEQRQEVVAVAEFHFNGCSNGCCTALLGGNSSVTIRTKNDMEPSEDDIILVELCKHYHNDFLYGWRVEKLEAENPEWLQWRRGQA